METAPLGSRKILLKVLALGFYQKHAGFFLLLLFFAAGFLRLQEHYLLMEAAVVSWPILLLFGAGWLLYGIFCIRFSWLALRQKENSFLYHFRLFPVRKQIQVFFAVLLVQLLPVLLYALCTATIGLYLGLWLSSLACLLFIVGMIGAGLYAYLKFFRQPGQQLNFLNLHFQESKATGRPSFLLPLFYFLHQQKLSFLLTKIISLTSILLVAYLYRSSTYDSRFATVALGVAGTMNSILVYQLHIFKNKDLPFTRNLPIPLPLRFMQFSFLLFLLMLPEIAVFIRHFSTWFEVRLLFEGSVMLVAIPNLAYSYLFLRPTKIEVFLSRVVGFFLLYYLLIIFGTPVYLLASSFLLISYFVFIRFYYRFEPGHP